MPPEIGFRPVTPADYPLLLAWLRAPHVREWWGDPEEELALIRDMVEGRDTTRPYLIELAGRPVGYIQVWFVDDNREYAADHPWIAELPPATVGVDLTIGDPALLSR
ncbi:MAG TPA: GNAT family N-acetyltransferase, partial [Amaricoccus sp.]|uniref:GNAT family N-acetyltransferase n=2 Tax=Amaricoccus TaxID=56999 RepID=UPI002CC66352